MPRKARPDPACGRATRQGQAATSASRRRLAAGAVGGDVGIPGLAAGDDGMQRAVFPPRLLRVDNGTHRTNGFQSSVPGLQPMGMWAAPATSQKNSVAGP